MLVIRRQMASWKIGRTEYLTSQCGCVLELQCRPEDSVSVKRALISAPTDACRVVSCICMAYRLVRALLLRKSRRTLACGTHK